MADQPQPKSSGAGTRMLVLGTIVVGIIGAVAILYTLGNRPTRQPATTDTGLAIIEGEAFTGIEPVEPPRELADFTLTDQNNQPIKLSDLRGKMALLLFGYTHCPDVCPGTLLNYKQIKQTLGDDAEEVAFVFISVDGERDTPEVVKDYVERFDPSFIGITGTEAQLQEIGGDYDLYVEKSGSTDSSNEDYFVIHNSNTYLVDKNGQLVALYIYGTEADVIADDIRARLNS